MLKYSETTKTGLAVINFNDHPREGGGPETGRVQFETPVVNKVENLTRTLDNEE